MHGDVRLFGFAGMHRALFAVVLQVLSCIFDGWRVTSPCVYKSVKIKPALVLVDFSTSMGDNF